MLPLQKGIAPSEWRASHMPLCISSKGQSLSQERFEEAHKAGSIFDWDPKNRDTVSSIRKSRKSRSRRVHSGGTKGKGSCRQYGRKAGGALLLQKFNRRLAINLACKVER